MFFKPKTVQQVAALPFIVNGDEIEILLITTRRRGRWVVPKGWPAKGLALAEAAEHEAMEEAGVIGVIGEEPIGAYRYTKRIPTGYDIDCSVLVYPLLVVSHLLDWPERQERQAGWYPLAEAAEKLGDDDLAALVAGFARSSPPAFKQLVTRPGA